MNNTAIMPKMRKLGWGGFALQLLTIALIYLAASAPTVLIWGQTSWAMIASVVLSMGAALLVAAAWASRDGTLAQVFALQPPRNWGRALGLALFAALVILVWFQIGVRLTSLLGMDELDVGPVMQFVTESPVSFAAWVVGVAWLSAGIGEEILYRGFLLNRLMRLPGLTDRPWAANTLHAMLFGLPHLYQGLSGFVVTSVVGAFLGWIRLRVGGSLWPLIIAHAAVDTIMMSAAYFTAG